MSPKTLLLTTAAAAALACGPALAKPVHRHHKAPVESPEITALKEEVELLKAHVQSLEERLETQGDVQKRTQAELATAQAAAASAQASAEAANAQVVADAGQIKTIPGVVEASVKKNTPKPGWWADTSVGGTIFADVSTISNKNAAGKTAQSGTDYDIKRAYLIVNHKFNDTYSFNLTTDFTFDNNTTSPSGASKPTINETGGANTVGGIKATQLYIKKAYLQAHYADAFNIRLGAADMPWVPFVEGLNGYRFADQVLIDRTKFGTSADWGVHVYGDLLNKLVSYQVSVVDGEGYKQPSLGTVNRTNSVDVEGRVSIQKNGFVAAVGGYEGKLGSAVENVLTFNTAKRIDVLGAYSNKLFRIGFEYLWANDWSDVTQSNPAKINHSEGYSIFGSVNATKKISLFGKFEYVKPKEDTLPTFHENYFVIGLDYKPIPALDMALVYKRDQVNDGSFSTGNGVIGIPTGVTAGAGAGVGTYDEFGLFTQVKF